jgi:hypothetical protein
MCQRDITQKPSLNRAHWSLACLTGVRVPRIWSAADLAALPYDTMHYAGYCAHAPDDLSQVEAGAWRGVPFATLVEQVQPASHVNTALLSAHSGSTVSLPLSALQNALLALDTQAHTRLIIPGLPVCCLPYGIAHITFTSQPATMPVPLPSRVWVEARSADAVSGLAYRGVNGLEGVSVRLNHGPAVRLGISAPEGRITRWRLPLPGGFSGMLHVSAEPVVSQVRA